MKAFKIGAAVLLTGVLLASTACVRRPLPEGLGFGIQLDEGSSGSSGGTAVRSVEQTIDLDGATHARVSLTMGAGEMSVRSGDTSALAAAEFTYGNARLKPTITYDITGSTGNLEIAQPEVAFKIGVSSPNSWDVRLAKGVPMDLAVHIGAGSSDVDLSDVDVRDLAMRLGAGETTVDLTGPRAHDLHGDLQAGVGQLVIRVPRDVGVRVSGRKGGIGTFEADSGFHVEGDAYVNDAYGTSPVTIDLSVIRGVGEVRLEMQ